MLCIVALNYAAFRLELFEDEYKDNHPLLPNVVAFTPASLTWETFDKNNAPEAFSFNARIAIEPLSSTPTPVLTDEFAYEPQELIRDKSPPIFLLAA